MYSSHPNQCASCVTDFGYCSKDSDCCSSPRILVCRSYSLSEFKLCQVPPSPVPDLTFDSNTGTCRKDRCYPPRPDAVVGASQCSMQGCGLCEISYMGSAIGTCVTCVKAGAYCRSDSDCCDPANNVCGNSIGAAVKTCARRGGFGCSTGGRAIVRSGDCSGERHICSIPSSGTSGVCQTCVAIDSYCITNADCCGGMQCVATASLYFTGKTYPFGDKVCCR